jgi:hypothetical protein
MSFKDIYYKVNTYPIVGAAFSPKPTVLDIVYNSLFLWRKASY